MSLRRMTGLLASLVLSTLGMPQAPAPPPKPTLVKAGRLLDVRSGRWLTSQGILIEKDRIQEVGPLREVEAHAPKDAVVIDLGGAAVLPGLVDAHAHLLDAMQPQWRTDEAILLTTQMSAASRALLGARMAKETLDGGVTTVRSVGHSGPDGDVALRDAVEAGWVPGPRILACARKIAPPGGQAVRMRSPIARLAVEQDYIGVSTPEEARRAVRENLAVGADLIKVVVDAGPRTLSLDDLKAIVEEAHRAKVKVAAHATGERAIEDAVMAGVDSIDHGDDVSDDALKLMHDRGIFLVETALFSTPARFLEFRGSVLKLTAEDRKEIDDYFEEARRKGKARVARAAKAGVAIAAGSDMWFLWPEKTRGQATLLELEGLVEEGMTPAEALRAATITAAELLGWQDRVGEIAAGRLADIIALDGDPLRRISDLQSVKFVMKGGAVIRSEYAPK